MMKIRIAIQGIKGAFHDEVAMHLFGHDTEIVPCITFKELAENVAQGRVEKAVMAIENTIAGTMHENLELIRLNGLQIIGELPWKIQQNLCVVPGTSVEMLTEIHSHHMALKQCKSYLDQYPQIKLVETDDTALSIKNTAENRNCSIGALGSTYAANLYGLEIVGHSIQSESRNYTRFLVLSKSDERSNSNNKISLSLVLKTPYCISDVLNSIINMNAVTVKLETVTIPGEPWVYRYYLDCITTEPSSIDILTTQILNYCDNLSILGKYKSNITNYVN